MKTLFYIKNEDGITSAEVIECQSAFRTAITEKVRKMYACQIVPNNLINKGEDWATATPKTILTPNTVTDKENTTFALIADENGQNAIYIGIRFVGKKFGGKYTSWEVLEEGGDQ